jgi:hypothetical protein
MPRYLCHHEGWFFEWSTVVDAPVTLGMRFQEFKDYYMENYGEKQKGEFPDRIKRALRNGTSYAAGDGMTLAELVSVNRAGHNETNLTLDEVIRIYCVEQREPKPGEGVKLTYDDVEELD